jgi:putative hemolysin
LGVGIEVVFIVLLVFANGILAGTEAALVSVRQARLQQRAREGDQGARAALELVDSPNRFLATVQIGITLIGVLAGAFGGATLASKLSAQLDQVPYVSRWSDAVSLVMIVIAITYLSLIIGELVPKRLALRNPEGISSRVARPMQVISTAAGPAVTFLSGSTDLVLRLLRVRPSEDPPVTEDEVRVMIQQGAESGVFDPAEEDMILKIFRLADRRAIELMTARPQIDWINIADPPEKIQATIKATNHTVFPVCNGDLDEVLGFVSIKSLWSNGVDLSPDGLRRHLTAAQFVPENTLALTILRLFQQTGNQAALVVDEYGSVEGLVTLADLVEDIVGDIEFVDPQRDRAVVVRDEHSWLMDGILPVHEVAEVLGIPELPGEEEGRFQTLGGFVMDQLGRVPAAADDFVWDGLRFEVVDMDGNRVDKVLVERLPLELDDEPATELKAASIQVD